MEKLIKLSISVVNGVINFGLWIYMLLVGSLVVQALLNSMGAVSRFSKSRGSIFDVMALNQNVHNPLGNSQLDPNLLKIFLVISFIAAVVVLIRGFRTVDIRTCFAVNFLSLSGITLFCAIVHGASKWFLLNNSGGATSAIMIGFGISIGLVIAANVIAPGTLKKLKK